MQAELFSRLCEHLKVEPDRRGEAYITCPFCGKESKRRDVHFSFSERGYHCFVCGAKGGLKALAERTRLDTNVPYVPPAPRLKPSNNVVMPPPWVIDPVHWLHRYASHPMRYEFWECYKPVTRATIDRWKFGVGRLSFQSDSGSWRESKDDWLTVPLFENGKLVGIKGRNLGTIGPKWISASGTRMTCWNLDGVQPKRILWIMENYVDAALLMQFHPECSAVAIGGAALWRPEWTIAIARAKPSVVVIALDNDLIGNGGGHLREQLIAKWSAEHGVHVPIPQANGPKIANELLRARVKVRIFQWPKTAAPKADIGTLIIDQLERTTNV